ncbi:MAG: A/G-specific adenine glycosylase [Akkermansiaceae bacterium]|nr:A/G-specific adenine glycosylase [Akkermansiaceae bacterium]
MPKPPATKSPLKNRRAFQGALLRWFADCGRDYPWRRTTDPYAILVSEVMLQQTTVGAVLRNRRFERFLDDFPDLASLAAAPEPALLKAWEGLGYYNRVRNLQKTAQAVLADHAGVFPSDPARLATLPGVGRYIAGALATFAFNRPVPVVEANIARVLTRLFDAREPIDTAAGREQLWEWAAALVPAGDPRLFNSALMELGQSHCSGKSPACLPCPVRAFCKTRRPGDLPVKKPKRETVVLTEHVLFARRRNGALLLSREEGARRRGLWKLPERPAEAVADLPRLATRKYSITHHRVTLHIHRCPPAAVPPPPDGAVERFHPPGDLAELPMPSPFRKALEALL